MDTGSGHRRARGSAGFTLLEVTIAMGIFAVASAILVHTFHAGQGLRTQAREESSAMNAAQAVLERMRGTPFGELLARYDDDPANDPLGPGTAPGATFAVAQLSPTADDPDGLCGEVRIPVVDVGVAGVVDVQVREDVGDPELGIPRDLNGDGSIDSRDHRSDAIIVPVIVTVRWQSRKGPRELELHTAITELGR